MEFNALFNTVSFDSYNKMRAAKLIEAFQGYNSEFKEYLVSYKKGLTQHSNLETECPEKILKSNGFYVIYSLFNDNSINDFIYTGTSVDNETCIKDRIAKEFRHSLGLVGKGDHVLPVSRFIKNERNGNLSNIKCMIFPVDIATSKKNLTKEDIKEIESEFIKLLTQQYGTITVKNKQAWAGSVGVSRTQNTSHNLPI